MNRFVMIAAALLVASAQAQTVQPAYRDASLPAAVRAHDLVSRMTLEEKANQLVDGATAIPRLGVPDYETWNEALHGVARAGYATVFPQAIGVAATWDPALVKQMGDVIATEGRAIHNQTERSGNHRIYYGLTYWSPNINIFRDPRWGRGQETYGEDPFLTGRMGMAFVEGVQGNDPEHPKAVATSKHFAVHSGPESLRHSFDVTVSPRDLEETYLPAFRTTVVEGRVKSVMCAYNAIDGMAACADKMLLKDHLREAWGFKGFVVSDCGAITDVAVGHHNAADIPHASVISLEAGTDLSCDGSYKTLAKEVRDGVVSEDLLTQAAERLYTARFQLGLFDAPGTNPYDKIGADEIASAEHRQLALKIAEESIVLLKNDGVLPFKESPRSIAVVGPTADLLTALEGNYNGTPLHPAYPLDAIQAQFPDAVIHYAQGATLATGADVPVPRSAFGAGLHTEYFATPDWTGRPVAEKTEPNIQDDWINALPVPELQTHDYSVRWTGKLTVPAAGHYTFTLARADSFPFSPKESFRFVLDGRVIAEGDLMRKREMPEISVALADTHPHDFRFEYSHAGDLSGGGITLKWQPSAEPQLQEAVTAAKESDIVLAFVGLSPNLEGEEMSIKIDGFTGGDRTSLDLPLSQQKMLEAVAATGKPVIVISLSGSALALNWAKQNAAAILQAWYPGVEGGTAIARTLAGLNNPAGRLPVTFYAGTSDLPEFTDYSFKNRTYRYYTGKPIWGFGYGLSYSTFRYSPVKLSESTVVAGQPLTATVTVTNTGKLAGDEVVEAYLKTPQKDGPLHSLVGIERVHLAAGEAREVSIPLSPRLLSSVNNQGERSVLAGEYRLSIGAAQPEETQNRSEISFKVKGSLALPK
jgi:beta-glucosidase